MIWYELTRLLLIYELSSSHVAWDVSSLAGALTPPAYSTNFNLNIEDKKRDDHVLVTHGIYQYIRHPAYFGFFYWSIATQVVLVSLFSPFIPIFLNCYLCNINSEIRPLEYLLKWSMYLLLSPSLCHMSTPYFQCNPLCIVAYTIASFKFFENRIPYEEHTLRIMFGKQWDEFKARTPTGIPFIP